MEIVGLIKTHLIIYMWFVITATQSHLRNTCPYHNTDIMGSIDHQLSTDHNNFAFNSSQDDTIIHS